MKRSEKLRDKAEEIIQKGQRPSAQLLAQELDWIEEDVHSCLNSLEKEEKVETYVKNVLDRKVRMVSIKR